MSYSRSHETSDLRTQALKGRTRERLEGGLRSKDAFTPRRSQILLASARGGQAPRIARSLGCSSQTVRDDAIHAFNERGLDALVAASSRPERTNAAFDEKGADEAVREMLHRSPRGFGRDTSLRTLETAAQVSFEEGLVRRRLSGETIRATLARLLGVRWQRAKRWITSPDPLYQRKKGGATGSDGSGRGRPSVGSRLRGGVLVESAGFAHFE
jgi:hypothetical protein